ncbi:hypothetical protein OAO01_05005 [Oligoflexia bacterium]|nr:hypothetical protein [Oligoflexia bacterium]
MGYVDFIDVKTHMRKLTKVLDPGSSVKINKYNIDECTLSDIDSIDTPPALMLQTVRLECKHQSGVKVEVRGDWDKSAVAPESDAAGQAYLKDPANGIDVYMLVKCETPKNIRISKKPLKN